MVNAGAVLDWVLGEFPELREHEFVSVGETSFERVGRSRGLEVSSMEWENVGSEDLTGKVVIASGINKVSKLVRRSFLKGAVKVITVAPGSTFNYSKYMLDAVKVYSGVRGKDTGTFKMIVVYSNEETGKKKRDYISDGYLRPLGLKGKARGEDIVSRVGSEAYLNKDGEDLLFKNKNMWFYYELKRVRVKWKNRVRSEKTGRLRKTRIKKTPRKVKVYRRLRRDYEFTFFLVIKDYFVNKSYFDSAEVYNYWFENWGKVDLVPLV